MEEVPMTMAELWTSFSTAVVLPITSLNSVQYREMRRAFYAGMIGYNTLVENIPEDENEAVQVLKNLQEERIGYIEALYAERWKGK